MIVAGLDIETTGFLKPEHRIIELCVQKWDYDPASLKADLIGTETWRIHPERSIDAKALAVHGISLDDLASAPTWDKCAPYILDHMRDVDLFVGHNGNEFDRPFIRMEVERIKLSVPQIDAQKWFDTMLSGRWANTWGKVPTLRELCWACDVEYDPSKAHAAEYDVRQMMQSFFFGLKTGFFTLPS
jgi:DNA polymerase-3 subunit epsilon